MSAKTAEKPKTRLELEQEAKAALPEIIEISLPKKDAKLWLRPQLSGRWMADVRWRSGREADHALADGGHRHGYAESAKAAEALGRRLYEEGPGGGA